MLLSRRHNQARRVEQAMASKALASGSSRVRILDFE